MVEWIFQALGFLSSNSGLLVTGALSALVILLWDWRVALAGILLVQLSVATAGVILHSVPPQWAFVQTVVVGLVCLMLSLSARAQKLRPALRQTGTWVSRGLLLGMFLAGAWFLDVQVTLPGMDPLVMELFVWLVLCGIMLMGLSDHPMYNAIGFLLWLIPMQLVVAVVVPHPTIVAMVGLLVLLTGLATSYLVTVEHIPPEDRGLVLTDLAFPQQIRLERAPATPGASAGGAAQGGSAQGALRLPARNRRRLPDTGGPVRGSDPDPVADTPSSTQTFTESPASSPDAGDADSDSPPRTDAPGRANPFTARRSS
ncbi:MAG: hypothetical protein WDZ49_08820 [Litorilinea sp.]